MPPIVSGFSYSFDFKGPLNAQNPNLPPQPTFEQVLADVQAFAETKGWTVSKSNS